jgi:hypothetical protein
MSVLSGEATPDRSVISGTVDETGPLGPATARGPSDVLGGAFRTVDSLLRRCMRIRQFCSDRDCIFRVALTPAAADIRLADGTEIKRCDTIGELHLWNENLPRIPAGGAGIAWGIAMRRRFERSLRRLAIHIEDDPQFAAIDGFRGSITFAGRLGRPEQVARLAEWYGFEVVLRPHSFLSRLREIVDSLFACCLIRAFNPAGLRRSWLSRQRHEIWMSKRVLIERHGHDRAGRRRGHE